MTDMTEALSKLNFRDVGGLPTETGGILRPGIIFRSEGPANFEPIHRNELAALGIKLVCDLRADTERAKDPNDWAERARLLNLDVTADLRVQTNDGWMALKNDPTPEAAKKALINNYAAIPDAIRPHLHELIVAIVEGETPVFIHCTAGKDRTGVLMALLLKALHVSDDLIFADYLRSDVFAQNLRLRGGIHEQFEEAFGFRPSEALIDAMIGVDLEMLNAAIAAVERDWQSIEGYFAAAGIDAPLLARFRETLTVELEQGRA
jgi:protein-tyrosine phosphatase